MTACSDSNTIGLAILAAITVSLLILVIALSIWEWNK